MEIEDFEIKEWKDWNLPVLQHCAYCDKIFPDKGCGICFECYEKAIDDAYQESIKENKNEKIHS